MPTLFRYLVSANYGNGTGSWHRCLKDLIPDFENSVCTLCSYLYLLKPGMPWVKCSFPHFLHCSTHCSNSTLVKTQDIITILWMSDSQTRSPSRVETTPQSSVSLACSQCQALRWHSLHEFAVIFIFELIFFSLPNCRREKIVRQKNSLMCTYNF